MSGRKAIMWMGCSRSDLLAFPLEPRRQAGFELEKVQRAVEPSNWKSLGNIGQGIREIRIRSTDSIFRVVYIATFPEAIYVIHCFQKKSQALTGQDTDMISQRYRSIIRSRSTRQ